MTTGCTKWMPIGIATVLHFLVDGLCACCLYLMVGAASRTEILTVFLSYNILAFITQPLTGLWIDHFRHKQMALLIATSLLTTAVVLQLTMALWWDFSLFSMMPVSFLLGMGNSLFHVWGGKLTAVITGNDMRCLGIFVSSGILGLTIGVLYASWWLLAGMLLLITILGAISMCLQATSVEARATLPLLAKSQNQIWFWLLVILTFVLLRSFVGEIVTSGLEKKSAIVLLLAALAMIGKAIGGWLARWWGIRHAIVTCVGITSACMMCGEPDSIPLLLIVLGVFAINCTMPMTLHLANQLLPWHEGLAFGLLAAVLIPGNLLANNLNISPDHYFMLSALLLTISIEIGMLMLMGEKRKDVLMGAVAVNILTNVPLNYFLLTFGNSMGRIVTGELLVLLVETLWYFIFVHQWRKAAIYSLLCNTTSFLVGILIQIIINYSL